MSALCSFFVFYALFGEFCKCACAKKDCFAYQKWVKLILQKRQDLSLETSFINQFLIYQMCKVSPFDKTNKDH